MKLSGALRLRRMEYSTASWEQTLDRYPSAEVFHSPEWLEYLVATQGAEPVIAAVERDGATVGYFVGGIVRRFGLQILGSPLKGWGTNVMGFLLDEGVDRRLASEALLPFAFGELGCVHVELGDRFAAAPDVEASVYAVSARDTSEVDLTGSEEEIVSRMRRRTRTYVRRASRMGLATEDVSGVDFADEYYQQLVDVFASSALTPTYGVDRVRRLIEIVEPSGQLSMIRLLGPDGDRVATIITIGRNSRAALWGLAWHRSVAELHPVEPIQWAAMRHWRERGVTTYDMDGNDQAKAKFGGRIRTEYRLHRSRYAGLDHGRDVVEALFYARQRVMGRLMHRSGVRT